MKKLFCLFLFVSNLIFAADIVIYNPTDVIVPNKVIGYLRSVHTPDYSSITNKIINPNISSVINIPIKYWKVVVNQIIEMTVTEKSNVEANIPKYKSRLQIMNDIYTASTSTNQLQRLVKSSYFAAFQTTLDDYSYGVARQLLQWALNEGHITQGDYDLIYSKIPE